MKKSLLLFAICTGLNLCACSPTSKNNSSSGDVSSGTSSTTQMATQLTQEQAQSIINEMKQVQRARATIRKACFKQFTNDDLKEEISYDLDSMSSYSLNKDTNNDGSYVFHEGNTGYYYYTSQSNDVPPTSIKYYKQFNNLTSDDLDISTTTPYNTVFKNVFRGIFEFVNKEMNFEANRPNAKYSSNGPGHFKCEYTSLDQTKNVYEWENYLPKEESREKDGVISKQIFKYENITIKSPANRSEYTLYEGD